MIHPARKDTLAREFGGFGVKEFCAAYRTTNPERQITEA
jgi:hypothetical protein